MIRYLQIIFFLIFFQIWSCLKTRSPTLSAYKCLKHFLKEAIFFRVFTRKKKERKADEQEVGKWFFPFLLFCTKQNKFFFFLFFPFDFSSLALLLFSFFGWDSFAERFFGSCCCHVFLLIVLVSWIHIGERIFPRNHSPELKTAPLNRFRCCLLRPSSWRT